MRNLPVAVILILCLLLAHGCTSASVSRSVGDTTPISFVPLKGTLIERTVGKLRRLAVLPVSLEVEPKNPKWCLEKCAWEGLDSAIENEVVACLQDKRGYEILSLSAGWDGTGYASLFTPEEVSALTEKLAAHARDGDPLRPPTDVADLVKKIGTRAGIDGIMVIQGKAVTLDVFDYASWFASFSLLIPFSMARAGVTLRADVYETATGRNVWTEELSSRGVPNQNDHYGKMLCDVMEQSIPRILTRPLN
jgi:hypothetical protein